MKTTRRHLLTILILPALLGISGCEGFLDEVPYSFLTPENFYKTEADAYSATIAAYSMLNSHELFNNHLFPTIDMTSDDIDLRPGELTPDLVLLENFRFGPADADRPTVNYYGCFYGIKDANVVIDRIPQIAMNETKKAQFLAEAYFLRSLYYYYAVRMFGDLPKIVHETTSLENLEIPRSPVLEIYNEIIIPGLQIAETNLPINAAEPGRATQGAAKALLASVYLTMAGQPLELGTPYFTLARDKAKEVIDMSRYDLFASFSDVFDPLKKNGTEHIFDAQFDRNIEGKESIAMWLTWPRNIGLGNGLGLYLPSATLISSFDTADLRIDVTYKTQYPRINDGKIIKFPPHIWKFFDQAGYADNQIQKAGNNFPLIRYAEILLIYAEASNEVTGPNQEAYDAINRVRSRAGLTNLSGLSGEEFRQAVYEERRHEFVFECKKWFDLVRTGRFLDVMTANGKTVSEKHLLFPIPQQEMDVNTSLVQNPGYDN